MKTQIARLDKNWTDTALTRRLGIELPIIQGRGVVAAFALGADGVQIGTAFLAAEESGANALHRAALLEHRAGDTALTRALTGRLARGIRNRLVADLDRPETAVLPYPLQRALVKNLTALAEKSERAELLQMWAGQAANLTRHGSAVAFLGELVAGVSG